MRSKIWMVAGLGGAVLLSGCPGVPYNPATNTDTTCHGPSRMRPVRARFYC